MRDFVIMRARTCTKYRVAAVPGHQIIPAAISTPSNVADTTALPEMPGTVRRYGPGMPERLPHADMGHDSDRNCAKACETGMVPNAGQRKN